MNGTTVQDIVIPERVVDAARRSIGVFFQPICKADPEATIQDFLDTGRSLKRAQILERYVSLRSKKLLEIGSGFGTNLAVWIKHFDADAYGVEPGSIGFNEGYNGSLELLAANGIDPSRVIDACGESIPFPDESFDIVYSANVLEHTVDPQRVIAEAIRVLRKSGILHIEMPNFLSYFEPHYLVFQPPLVWKSILPWWVRAIYRRDPAFAKTLHTEINPLWCRRNIRRLNQTCALELISCGEDLFLERLSKDFRFEMRIIANRLRHVISALQAINFGNWMGRVIVEFQGYYPIYLTVRKL